MIHQIEVHSHRVMMDKHEQFSAFIKETITKALTHANLDLVDVFNMKGESTHVKGGNKKRLIILGNHPQHNEGSVVFNAPDGTVLAEYIESEDTMQQMQQLNIFIDLFGAFNDENKALFVHLMNELNGRVFLIKVRENSWKHTSKKDELTARFTSRIKAQQENYIREDKHLVEEYEVKIRELTQRLKNTHVSRIQKLNAIQAAEAKLGAVSESLIADLDNIVKHPKVKDLYLENGKFIVHTEPLYAYHDRTGERYYIGNMKIEMNPDNTDVRFFGDNPRRSHWTEKDPHPHVNGRSGNACLGNVASTIAELCAQMELYALTLICIDFLESVNTSDPAGKNIINWDKVDEEGNIIQPPAPEIIEVDDEEEMWACEHCDEEQHEDANRTTVYTSYTADVDTDGDHYNVSYGDQITVCDQCLREHYVWQESIDAYVQDGEYDVRYDDEDGEY